jgi:hypothetical protein
LEENKLGEFMFAKDDGIVGKLTKFVLELINQDDTALKS